MLIRLIVLLLIFNAHTVKTENVQAKSSLTFVIDDTGSMYDDIEAVKREANSIFDTVVNSEGSQIEDFIIVTFNDPDTALRAKTRSRIEFKTALNTIRVNGGDDCPEMALGGIIEALKQSKHGSTLYVFTDASAKDYSKNEQVRRLSQQKQCQVVFILTGMCSGGRKTREYLVYEEIAQATNGQVFHLYKDDVSKILNYVKESIKGRKTNIISKVFKAGYGNKVEFFVDDKMKDITVSVSGDGVKSSITGPSNTKPVTTNIVSTNGVKITKILETVPGMHTAIVGSKSVTAIVVSGRTNFTFEHGFSAYEPTTLFETSKQPIPGRPCFLSIQPSEGSKSIDLETVHILDMEDNLIRSVDLNLIDDEKGFYTSTPFLPPNTLFKILINGYDTNSKSVIRRMSNTPVEPQTLTESNILRERPVVNIIEGAVRKVDYGSSKSLTCFVQSYPTPIIEWIDEYGTQLIAQTAIIELPNKFGSYLKVKNFTKDTKYICKARNNIGSDTKIINLKVVRYFHIKEIPADKTIEVGKDDRLICKIDAKPAVTIRWYHNGTLIKNNDHYRLSLRDSVLNIRNMSLQHVGQYECEAENVVEKKIFTVNIFISGLETDPRCDGSAEARYATTINDNNKPIHRVHKGNPKPFISWYYKSNNEINFTPMMFYDDYLMIENINETQSGYYKCVAENVVGRDEHDVQVIVQTPATIVKNNTNEVINVLYNTSIVLLCKVIGKPQPQIVWENDDGTRLLGVLEKGSVANEYNYLKGITVTEDSNFVCVASNNGGSDRKITSIKVKKYFNVLEIPPEIKRIEVASEDHLTCAVDAEPPATITWHHNGKMVNNTHNHIFTISPDQSTITIKYMTPEHVGNYYCDISNPFNRKGYQSTVIISGLVLPKIDKKPNVLQKKLGSNLDIYCGVIAGNPRPKISWFFKEIDQEEFIVMDWTEELLNITNLQKSNNGEFKCVAENVGGKDTYTIRVIVEFPPTIIMDNMAKENIIEVKYNYSVGLTCKVYAKPQPIIFWKDGNDNIFTGATYRGLRRDEYINYFNTKINNDTTYECFAKNVLGSDNKITSVFVKRHFNVIEHPPKDIPIDVESTGRLACRVDAEPTANVTWYHNGTQIKENTKIFNLSTDQSVITIENMGLEHIGDYYCIIKNSFESKLFPTNVTISGLVAPKIRNEPINVNPKLGTDYKLHCRVLEAKPKPKITWLFKANNDNNFKDLFFPKDALNIANIHKSQSGEYKCIARNIAGQDTYNVKVDVEYPPIMSIDNVTRQITVREGDKVELPCKYDAYPSASVRWQRGNTILSGPRYKLYKNKHLGFVVGPFDGGNYICVVKNIHGTAMKEIQLKILVPGQIETPDNKSLEVLEGMPVILKCQAFGHPKPKIEWTYRSFDGLKPSRILEYDHLTGSASLSHSVIGDSGYYTCVASNQFGSNNITYRINVVAPAKIINKFKDKYTTVIGDQTLLIPCIATGNPKPGFVWLRDGFSIPSDTFWYDIGYDGTLTLKNIDTLTSGIYTCNATNIIGNDNHTVEVTVFEYPKEKSPGRVINAHIHSNVSLPCDIRKKIDSLRWYKGESLIHKGELNLTNVLPASSGVYTCRVSNVYESQSASVKLVVGKPPQFEDPDYIKEYEFSEENKAVLDCSVDTKSANVTWTYKGNYIDSRDLIYHLDMTLDNVGNYTCTVSNEFGSVSRNFSIYSPYKECLIKPTTFNHQPLILTTSYQWADFNSLNGNIHIPSGESFILFCPSNAKITNSFKKFPHMKEITLFCHENEVIEMNGEFHQLSEFGCNASTLPTVKNTGIPCARGDTELVDIGFNVKDRLLRVYKVCFDKEKHIAAYTNVELSYMSDDKYPPPKAKRLTNKLFGKMSHKAIYDCDDQITTISAKLGRWFHREDFCCFNRGLLVSPYDVRVGPSQVTTYNYLNTIPQWSTCNRRANWIEVENRVRRLAKILKRNLNVWTGTLDTLKLVDQTLMNVEIHLSDKEGRSLHIPQYVWKVVQDPLTNASIAIVQVNAPDLTTVEAMKYLKCRDICNDVSWTSSPNWSDMRRGFTYCCSILEFQEKFNYPAAMFTANGQILRETSSNTKSSY